MSMNETHHHPPSAFRVALAFAIVYIVWGSTYFFIQVALHGFPPFVLGAARFLMSGMILLGWSILQGERIFYGKQIKHAAISGILLLFIGTGVVIWVEQFMPSSLVAITVSSSPLWFVLLDKKNWGVNFKSRATIAGIVIGFAGVILLFGETLVDSFSTVGNNQEIGGMALIVIGSMAWAGGSLYSKYRSKGSATVNSAWQMLAAGVAFIPGSFFGNELQNLQWHTIPINAWLSVLYLVFFGSIAGFSAYVWLLKVRPATQVSTHAYVNPVVAVLLGVFFGKENISAIQLLGLITILASVLMINMARYMAVRDATAT